MYVCTFVRVCEKEGLVGTGRLDKGNRLELSTASWARSLAASRLLPIGRKGLRRLGAGVVVGKDMESREHAPTQSIPSLQFLGLASESEWVRDDGWVAVAAVCSWVEAKKKGMIL
jgi:hypothetical protein